MTSIHRIICYRFYRNPFTCLSRDILNPSDIWVGEVWTILQMRVILGASRLHCLSFMPPGEGCKSCCPLATAENKEEPPDKKRRKSSWVRSVLSPLSVCVCLCFSACLFHPVSACALLLCHPQGCIWRRPSVDPFVSYFASCAPTSRLSTMRPGLSPARPFLLRPAGHQEKVDLLLRVKQKVMPEISLGLQFHRALRL